MAIQGKLAVAPPGDIYEREADAVAARVMADQPVQKISRPSAGGPGHFLQRQQQVPVSSQDRREFIRATTGFFDRSAAYFGNDRVSTVNQNVFEKVINNWYAMVMDRESMITTQLGGDPLLRRQLRAAYTAAIRALMSRAARVFGRDEADLYRENTGRIPVWAWRTPHHMEFGISTPVAQGRAADPITGRVEFAVSGFRVTIARDGVDPALGNRAETRTNIQGGNINFQWQQQGGQNVVTGFNNPGDPTVRMQTFYGPGVTAASPSGYGRGTTREDIAGGRVAPRSTTLGFHEGSHGLAIVEFIENNRAPQFTGRVGMTRAQFQAAINQYQADIAAYSQRLTDYSLKQTDCVGTTIDQFNQAEGAAGAQANILCVP